MSNAPIEHREPRLTFVALEITNFLSYKHARFEFGELVALVGPNASGKSNLVSAIKLLREIPIHGLPIALVRRGGFDQLRHRSQGRPNDPSLRVEFRLTDKSEVSFYEIRLGAVSPRSYRVKKESAELYGVDGGKYSFESDGKRVLFTEPEFLLDGPSNVREFPVPPGQSALASGGYAGYIVYETLQRMQTVEINPAVVGDLQDPSSTAEFEPDGSNATSVFELLTPAVRSDLVDELAAIVPGIAKIDVQRLADKQTFRFAQTSQGKDRLFSAKQMSDGTLRAFSILLALKQPRHPALFVIEEPEVAIHLGALRTMIDIFTQESEGSQIVITTHSADIVDAVPIESLRVVWSENGESHVGHVADHSVTTVRSGLITQGELLRTDSLDVAETS
ncbi:AAA family ATPase [Nocardioides aurantiacus]|uniref:Putative ATPase n=1 Tax=Nocardioides aurantiacus TaxID=86796 RepID=A0A3N2CUU9_9ACTN|nr:ATP-binding protein [Nocardioides aurantiacus]ROR91301.1 putative ATPase [Nocardioides aurantiacus]